MLGVSRQRAWQITKEPDFPVPVYRLKAGTFWLLSDVTTWAKARGRSIQ